MCVCGKKMADHCKIESSLEANNAVKKFLKISNFEFTEEYFTRKQKLSINFSHYFTH